MRQSPLAPDPEARRSAAEADLDPFLQEFFGRIPDRLARSFSPEQLAAIRVAFGTRTWGAHSIDIRRTLTIFGKPFYLVMLAGAEQSLPARFRIYYREHPLWKTANAFLFGGLTLLLLLACLGILYATKLALGIDIVPNVDMLPDADIQSFFQSIFD